MKYNGTWTSLGGRIYGEPSVVLWTWANGLWIHVAALGTDDKLYLQGIDNHGTPQGWGQLDLDGTLFVGPPNLLSRGANSLDVFATGEDGQIRWLRFANPYWSGPTTIPHDSVLPIVSKPAVARTGANGLELFAMSAVGANAPGMWHTSYDGSSWASFVPGWMNITPDAYNWGFQGTAAVLSGTGTGRVDVFSVARSGKLWWFWNGNEPHASGWNTANSGPGASVPPPLVDGGATGDPVAVSRGAGKMEVFYRTDNGRLAHMTTINSGATWTTEVVLPSYSIQ
jgi:hypothetical protein